MHTAELCDADLVAESLSGDRDAFGQIVERYQTLVASLAYCATGNVSQSEYLAQETFVSAWKQLAELREPAKLRPWLCSITRFLVSKELRRQRREPIHEAQSLDALDDWTSPEPLPPGHSTRPGRARRSPPGCWQHYPCSARRPKGPRSGRRSRSKAAWPPRPRAWADSCRPFPISLWIWFTGMRLFCPLADT